MAYGVGTLTLTNQSANEVAQRGTERAMLGFKRTHRITNKTIRQRTKAVDIFNRIAQTKWRRTVMVSE